MVAQIMRSASDLKLKKELYKTRIFYRGPSMLDPTKRVIGIIQLKPTKKAKTKGFAQIWVFPEIIQQYTEDHAADPYWLTPTRRILHTGADKACCHNCQMRSEEADGDGDCYCHGRTLFSGGNNMLRTLMLKGWPEIGIDEFRAEIYELYRKDIMLRVTAYGESFCLPDEYLEIMMLVDGTAYTHAWMDVDEFRANKWKHYYMASCNSIEQEELANSLGWRVFRVIPPSQEKIEFDKRKSFVCPASAEMGHRSSCGPCMGCAGKRNSFQKNVLIVSHSLTEVLMKSNWKRKELAMEMKVMV